MGWLVKTAPPRGREQTALVYELLDAHADTARLATEAAEIDLAWELRLRYLQRVAREQLACDVKR